MAVRLPASSKRSKHQPIGEYPGDHREHDAEDAEASRKVAEEAGYLGKKPLSRAVKHAAAYHGSPGLVKELEMNTFPTRMPSERANLTAVDALATSIKHGGLFVKAFRRVIGWFEVRPAALNPGLVRSLAYARINRDYDALGRS